METSETRDVKRRPNFSSDELEVLTREVHLRAKVLMGKFAGPSAALSRKTAWSTIAEQVSAVGIKRTADEVQKKWTTMKSASKKKSAEVNASRRRTGGGPSEGGELTTVDERVLSIIGPSSVIGVDGGLDTSDLLLGLGDPNTSADNYEKENFDVSLPTNNSLDEQVLPVHASTSAAAFKACPIAASKPFSNATLREATNFASSLHLPSQQKQTRTTAASYMKSSVDLQSSLGDTLQQLLAVEHERLAVERERLAVERERLDIEKSQLQVNIARYNLKLGVVGELVVPQMQ